MLERLAIFLAVAAAAFAGGAFLGYRYHAGRAAVAANETLATSIERDAEQTGSDNRLAESQGQRRTQLQVRARTVIAKGVANAAAKADPVRRLDDVSFVLLNDAVDVANGVGNPTETGGVPDGVRADAKADGPVGAVSRGVDVRGD